MTKKLEETLNLASPEDLGIEEEEVEEVETEVSTREVSAIVEETEQLKQELSVSKKIDLALSSVEDLTSHDKEMDDIALKALDRKSVV